jgi:hypothetical protein
MGSREIHLRTLAGRRYNYCGPNTRLQRRMTLNGTIRDGSEPINRVDEISMRHDFAYEDADEGRGTRLEAEKPCCSSWSNSTMPICLATN